MMSRYRPRVLWITRSAPFGLAIAREWGNEGLPAVAVPVLHVTPLAVSRPDGLPDRILFTSTQGVRHHPYHPDWKDVPVLAVGDTTASQALLKGYSNVQSAAGDVRDLQRLIDATLTRPARLFLFGAREAAGDLKPFLSRRGHKVESRCVYETRGSTASELRQAADLLSRIDGICVYSPKGAARVGELLQSHSWRGTVFCLSSACADRIQRRDGIEVELAARPNDHALRQLVRSKWRLGSFAGPLAESGGQTRLPATVQSSVNDNAEAGTRSAASAMDDDEPPPTAA